MRRASPHPREEGRTVEGRVLFYCFGQGNTSLFAEKELGRDPKGTKERRQWGGRGVPTGGADLKPEEGGLARPARTEEPEKVRPSLFPNVHKGGAWTLPKIWGTKKDRHAELASHGPTSYGEALSSPERLGNGALAQAVWPEPATKGHSQSGLIREASRCRTW